MAGARDILVKPLHSPDPAFYVLKSSLRSMYDVLQQRTWSSFFWERIVEYKTAKCPKDERARVLTSICQINTCIMHRESEDCRKRDTAESAPLSREGSPQVDSNSDVLFFPIQGN